MCDLQRYKIIIETFNNIDTINENLFKNILDYCQMSYSCEFNDPSGKGDGAIGGGGIGAGGLGGKSVT